MLCQRLLEQGFQVRALVRNRAKASRLAVQGVRSLSQGDLENACALQQLVTDCAFVIHGAGAVRGNSQGAFDRVNVLGTSGIAQCHRGSTATHPGSYYCHPLPPVNPNCHGMPTVNAKEKNYSHRFGTLSGLSCVHPPSMGQATKRCCRYFSGCSGG